ncbi:glutamyl-trna synthetase [Pyrenophora seminiperda CCB06]|uniref:Glutamyl-trna synthetase n=1 Tax=Pyrenophora seminiperda CCB06 TaxID=1302712 RepID=A0A3M7M8C8_9PLEO|nr:glutamyl-trna synthetase [Pyrenophora seminiperda CCB06]
MSSTPYLTALTAIDAAHALDPNKITISNTPTPYELHYAQKSTYYLSKRCPSASEPLRLAIRAQHFRRWEVPRSSYPMTRPGYHAWRSYLKTRQASLVEAICLEAGYSKDDAETVGKLIRKEGLRENEETMVLEDVACLVFLDDQFEAFEKEHDEEKIVGILRKSWGKMTERGRELAREVRMDGRGRELMAKALEG